MEGKPEPRTIPVRKLKVKPIYSTLGEHASLAIGFCFLALAGDLGRFTALTQIHEGTQSPFIPQKFILLMVASLLYLLFYKRYNYKFLAEDGLYFVRGGVATHIPWGMIQSAKAAYKNPFTYIQVDISADQSPIPIFVTGKERLFRSNLKTAECFRKHVAVSGDI